MITGQNMVITVTGMINVGGRARNNDRDVCTY